MTDISTQTVNTIRVLSAEAIQKAKSGHPGLPLGAAPAGYALWQNVLKHNPKHPTWQDRDRFILSAGHGSMLLYSLLHLYGYEMSLEDLKAFRQFGANTPGHPELNDKGVEISTGPLGQGIANAVGMAMTEAHLAAVFNREGFPIVDHYTYALCGEGCLMEGISGEACSLAGTLKLRKLIILYDCNKITIEGDTSSAFDEDIAKRYEAYGWNVIDVPDGLDSENVLAALKQAKKSDRPTLIINHTVIGFGCDSLQGTSAVHGAPLGEENVRLLKEKFGWPEEAFYVPAEVYAHTQEAADRGAAAEDAWNRMFAEYAKQYPELVRQWEACFNGNGYDPMTDEALWQAPEEALATRKTSQMVLNALDAKLPNLFGGSADLAPSNLTTLKNRAYLSATDYSGSNIHFGIREHAMSAMVNGMAVHGGVLPFCATFFVFSDYMKNGMRMSALMKQRVLYVLTHDSIGVGEDGATHEPIEQLAALRSIPGMTVFRPADYRETVAAYAYAIQNDGPTSIVLSRQNLPQLSGTGKAAAKGAYIVSDSQKSTPDAILLATGSEVSLAVDAKQKLAAEGLDVRVVSMPSWEVFEKQCENYKESVLPKNVTKRVAIEAASSFGWHRYVGLEGKTVTIETFGESAPAAKLFEYFGLTADNVVRVTKELF